MRKDLSGYFESGHQGQWDEKVEEVEELEEADSGEQSSRN